MRHTPVETHHCDNGVFFVKREDLCCRNMKGAPPNAKMRGLYLRLQTLKNRGVECVGYMDTAISMAGWGISYFTNELNMRAVIYYPKYKHGYMYNQRAYIPQWEKYGAEIVPLQKPTLHSININISRKDFYTRYSKGVWLENGLPFSETMDEVMAECCYTVNKIQPKTIVCSVGSGVMLAGILKGLVKADYKMEAVVGCLVTNKMGAKKKEKDVLKKAGFMRDKRLLRMWPLLGDYVVDFKIIPTEQAYTDKGVAKKTFPCNPYYDLKALDYMVDNLGNMPKPVLFWNIGA